MTDTGSGSKQTSTSSRSRSRRRGRKTGVGLQPHKRTGIDIAIALLTPLVGQQFLDKYHLRDPLNRGLRYGTKTIFSTAASTTRQFQRIQNLRGGPTRLKSSGKDYYDLTPDDEQKMIVETLDEFAEEVLRPAAHDADEAATYPPDLIAKAAELGITAINIPEDFEGIAAHRSSVTNVLVAEALAYGDMGLALPILAPGGVASALTHWGSADQQATYLPERIPAQRREVIGTGRSRRRAVHHRGATERQAGAVHRRVVHQRPHRQGGSEHGNSFCGPGPGRARRCVGAAECPAG
jgi:Acyl-CoA dehydrogenase, N-terminal domain